VPLEAGLEGLRRSRWRPSDPAVDLVAPIVLAVIAKVGQTMMEREARVAQQGEAVRPKSVPVQVQPLPRARFWLGRR
jgi:hypothetical protein